MKKIEYSNYELLILIAASIYGLVDSSIELGCIELGCVYLLINLNRQFLDALKKYKEKND
mgnify:CR=1 FL=1